MWKRRKEHPGEGALDPGQERYWEGVHKREERRGQQGTTEKE